MNPSLYIGRSKDQVEEFISENISPVLDKYKDELGVKAEINV